MARGPEAGWYPNPEVANEVRWWDGEQWTAHTERNPMAVSTPPPPSGQPGQGPRTGGSGLRPIGDWMGDTLALIGSRSGHLFTLVLVLALLPNLLYGLALYTGFRDAEIRISPDGDSWVGTVGTGMGGTGVEAAELASVVVALVVAQLLGFVLWVAICRQIHLEKLGTPEPWSESLVPSFKRVFRVLGVQIMVGFAVFGAFVVLVLLAAVIHPVTLILTIPGLFIALLYFGTRLSLSIPAAALAPKGVWSLQNSFRLSAGHFGPLLGRLVLLAVVGFFGSMVLSTIGQIVGMSTSPVFGPGSQTIEVFNFETFFGSNPAGFLLLVVLSGLGNSILLGVMLGGMTVLYSDLGGETADDLKKSDSTSVNE